MHLLINKSLQIASSDETKANYQSPVYFADENLKIRLKIKPDDEAYVKVYGTGGYNSKLIYFNLVQSSNEALSAPSVTRLATWTGASGNFAFEAEELEIKKGNYFAFQCFYGNIWQHSWNYTYWKWGKRRTGTKYAHQDTPSFDLDIRKFEYFIEYV